MLERTENMTLPQSENMPLQSISREVDFAWLAGIIDGEANVTYCLKRAKNGKQYFMPKIRISNTDLRMIRKIAEIYKDLNLVFFYTISKRKKYNKNWKDQLSIEIASQGSVKKIIVAVWPYLVNKKDLCLNLWQMIEFVQSQRKGGRMTPKDKLVDYLSLPGFVAIADQFEAEKKYYIDPSTTKRRARQIVSW